jgi:hypothetical protein
VRSLLFRSFVPVVSLLAVSTPAAPAHADPELEVVQCEGSIAHGALSEDTFVDPRVAISCTAIHYGTDASITGAYPIGGGTGVGNFASYLVVPGTGTTYGTVDFPGIGDVTWELAFGDRSVGGVLEFAQGLGLDVMVGSGTGLGAGWRLQLREGQLVDNGCVHPNTPFVVVGYCAPITFRFTAEYLHDLPVGGD